MRVAIAMLLAIGAIGAVNAQDAAEHEKHYRKALEVVEAAEVSGSTVDPRWALNSVIDEARNNPTLPQRYAASAKWILNELDETSPLLRLTRRMQRVESRIDREETGEAVQRLQDSIVSDLDKLIEHFVELEEANGGGGKKASWRHGGIAELGSTAQTEHREWAMGALDKREALQVVSDKFPKNDYRRLVEQYYKALAEAKTKKR